MYNFTQIVEFIGQVIDGVGVAVILLGLSLAALRGLRHRQDSPNLYRQIRQDIGRAILLGLELLVAADIIRTVAITPTLNGVLVLGIIVLIRTFLSMALEVELQGKWPWQSKLADSNPQLKESESESKV